MSERMYSEKEVSIIKSQYEAGKALVVVIDNLMGSRINAFLTGYKLPADYAEELKRSRIEFLNSMNDDLLKIIDAISEERKSFEMDKEVK